MSFIPSRSLSTLCRRLYSTNVTPDLQVDNIVIGAGVVGLALGARLVKDRPTESTLILEKNKRVGEETSARNSEVIHSGIYYPEDSLKTKLCIQGKHMLYKLLEETSIPYRKVGKWIVAQNPGQHNYLQTLHEKANKLGVETYFLDVNEAKIQQPDIQAHSILVSPTTGIVDSHSYIGYLEQEITQNGGDVSVMSRVCSIQPQSKFGPKHKYMVSVSSGPDSSDVTSVLCQRVFNAGGLHADVISNMLMPGKYKLYYARGHYYSYNASVSINHLIYPCPEKNLAGLGTHLTFDMAGKVKFGPDVQYIDSPYDYTIDDDEAKKKNFANAVRAYFPTVREEKMQPDYAGIRPKLAGPGEPFRDFVIKEESEDGFKNFYTLIGIESPGLTSSLAIADHVSKMVS